MTIYEGKPIVGGIAIGRIFVYKRTKQIFRRITIQNWPFHITRFDDARKKAREQLTELYHKAAREAGEEQAMIFQVHAMLVDDEEFYGAVHKMIREDKVPAEYAVGAVGDQLAGRFLAMDDDFFKARAADVRDITHRIIALLQGVETDLSALREPVILVADELSPSETILLDKSKVLSFVTRQGSAYSHAAILARSMNIPSLSGLEIVAQWEGLLAIVDGAEGKLILNPSTEILDSYKARMEKEREERELLNRLKGLPDETGDGRKIGLYANIGSDLDAEAVLENDGAGIGLMRSEFLYLEKNTYPTEEELFRAYRSVVLRMKDKKVVIRTLDIGADKTAEYFRIDKEDNPAMGYRGIRICLDREDLFKTQLRAIYRAAVYGDVSVMFPMISSLEEVQKIKQICADVMKELKESSCSEADRIKEIPFGIMIETPAAVMISDLLAKEVDFFSVGTNDLTQYTLAIDRQNSKLDDLYNPRHEAVLRMIEMVVKNGHAQNCHVSICGELAADTTMTKRLIEMGVDALSVSPPSILPVRKSIRSV